MKVKKINRYIMAIVDRIANAFESNEYIESPYIYAIFDGKGLLPDSIRSTPEGAMNTEYMSWWEKNPTARVVKLRLVEVQS
jgi:hypothetical protein